MSGERVPLRNRIAHAALRPVPSRHRLGAASRAVRLGARTLRDGRRDPDAAALAFVVNSGLRFDPPLDAAGRDVLDAARAARRPLLAVGLHHPETYVAFRWVRAWADAAGVRAVPLVRGGTERPVGTGTTHVALDPDRPVLLQVRDVWRAGGLVGAMNDGREAGEPRTVEVAHGGTSIRFSTGLLELGERCGAAVVFVSGRHRRGRVAVRIEPPEAWAETDDRHAGWSVQAYAAFVRRELAHRTGEAVGAPAGAPAPPRR